MSVSYGEYRPIYVGETIQLTPVVIDGSGSIAGWTFAGILYTPGAVPTSTVVIIAIVDAANRIISVSVPSQIYHGLWQFEVRRTDDGLGLVIANGIFEVTATATVFNTPEPPRPWMAVKLRVASMLLLSANNMQTEWDYIIAESTRDATSDIYTALANKGYTGAQIAAADQFPFWMERRAAVVALERGSALASYPMEALKLLDPMEMIEKLGVILINGNLTAPEESPVGGVAHGRLAASNLISENPRVRWCDPANYLWR